MLTINIHQAKTHLSKLVDQVVGGESFVIARSGKPLVKVVALGASEPPRRLGFMPDIVVPDDFDHMAEAEIVSLFGG